MKIKKLIWFIVALAIAILFISCSTEVDNRDKTAAELKAEYEAALRKETHKRGYQEVMDDYVNRSDGSRFRCDHFVERGHSYLILSYLYLQRGSFYHHARSRLSLPATTTYPAG